MKILFTKTIQKESIYRRLGADISFDFVEVIKGHHIYKEAFDLKGYSLIFTSVRAVKSFFENDFYVNGVFIQKDYNPIYVVG